MGKVIQNHDLDNQDQDHWEKGTLIQRFTETIYNLFKKIKYDLKSKKLFYLEKF